MKATLHNGREGSASHNERSWKDDKSGRDIIAGPWTKWSEGQSLKQAEIKAYETLFGKHNKETNENYKKKRHPEKVRTIRQIYTGKKTRPLEQIIQIGDKNDHPKPEVFKACVEDFLKRTEKELRERVPDHTARVVLLSASIHYDETVPHAHLDYAFIGKDKNGNRTP